MRTFETPPSPSSDSPDATAGQENLTEGADSTPPEVTPTTPVNAKEFHGKVIDQSGRIIDSETSGPPPSADTSTGTQSNTRAAGGGPTTGGSYTRVKLSDLLDALSTSSPSGSRSSSTSQAPRPTTSSGARPHTAAPSAGSSSTRSASSRVPHTPRTATASSGTRTQTKTAPRVSHMPAATPRAAGVHTTAAPSRMTRYDSMANTVTLDSDGYPVNQLGERMSQDQIDLTEAHQDQIREGMELLEYRSQDLAALRQRPELRYKNWKDTKKGLVSDEEYQRRLKELSDEYDSVLFAEMAGAKSSNQERKIAKTLKSAAHVGKLALKGMLRSDMFIVEEVVPATVKAGVAGTEYAAHYGRATGLAMRDKVLPAAKEKSIAAGRQARYLGQTIMAALVEVRPSSIMRNAAMPSQIQEQNSQARTSGRRANARKLKQARTASTR